MIKKLRQISDVLPDLLVGIILYGILCECIGLLFVSDRLFYSVGLWVGLLCACLMAVHMAWTLNWALDLGEDGAVKRILLHNMLRYGVVMIIFLLLIILKAGNLMAAFLGVMGLKVAAYIQPFTHKIFRR